jgi:hypothetical protein
MGRLYVVMPWRFDSTEHGLGSLWTESATHLCTLDKDDPTSSLLAFARTSRSKNGERSRAEVAPTPKH